MEPKAGDKKPHEISHSENNESSALTERQKKLKELLEARARTEALLTSIEEEDDSEDEEPTTPSAQPSSEQEKLIALKRDKIENPFKYFVLKNMDDRALMCIFGKTKNTITLEDVSKKCSKDGKEVLFWNFPNIHKVKHNSVMFSSNGFTLQLQNPAEVTNESGIPNKDDTNARFKLVYPDWASRTGDGELTLEAGNILLRKKAQEYQNEQLALFIKDGGVI